MKAKLTSHQESIYEAVDLLYRNSLRPVSAGMICDFLGRDRRQARQIRYQLEKMCLAGAVKSLGNRGRAGSIVPAYRLRGEAGSRPPPRLMTQDEAIKCIIRYFHPEGIHCVCGLALTGQPQPLRQSYRPVMGWKCKCGRMRGLLDGTPFQRSRLKVEQIGYFIQSVIDESLTAQVARDLNISYRTYYMWRQRLKQKFAVDCRT
jgi:hypothetical protein